MNGKKFIIWGDDTYSSSRYKEELKTRFAAKEQSDLNYLEIDGAQVELLDLINAISSRPLLAETRFIVIQNLLASSRGREFEEKLLTHLSKLPGESVLAFFEQGTPASSNLFRALTKEKNSRRFDLPGEKELTKWIAGYVKDRGGLIEVKDAKNLAEILSNDLWAVSNELDKLLAYDAEIDREAIDLLIAKPLSPSIFGLLDAAMNQRKEEAYGLLDDLLSAGEAEMAILGMLNKQVRDLALVTSFPVSTDSDEIAKTAKIHPYGVKKARQLSVSIDKKKIAEMYDCLLRADKRIRTGEMSGADALNFLVSEI